MRGSDALIETRLQPNWIDWVQSSHALTGLQTRFRLVLRRQSARCRRREEIQSLEHRFRLKFHYIRFVELLKHLHPLEGGYNLSCRAAIVFQWCQKVAPRYRMWIHDVVIIRATLSVPEIVK